MKRVPVKIKLLHPDAKIPHYGSEEAAGFDLYSIENATLLPGESVMIKTGISLEIEPGYCFQFWDRSGLAKKGITHTAGLIDSDYRGEFRVILRNETSQPYHVEKGDRIIQAVPVPIVHADFEVVEELSDTERGEKGFHSTGKK